MTRKHDKNTEDILKDIPNGKIIINRHNSTHENTVFNKNFRYCSDGRGLVNTYSVFPGIELSFNYYYANYFEFQHRPVHSAIQINHCRSGRMGWKMQDQSTIYLGPGDLSLHTLHSVVFRYAGFRKYKKIEPVCFRTGGNYQRNSQSDDIRPKTPLYY